MFYSILNFSHQRRISIFFVQIIQFLLYVFGHLSGKENEIQQNECTTES